MPDWRNEIRARLEPLHLDPATEADIVEEIAQHLEDQLRDSPARRGTESDAVQRLLDDFDLTALRETFLARAHATPEPAGLPIGSAPFGQSLATLLQRDLVYGWRSLWRTRGATLAMILSLAVVIGANTAIFGLVDAMFLRRLPLPHAEQLATIVPVGNGRPASMSYARYRLLQASSPTTPIEAFRFEGVTATTSTNDYVDLWIDRVTGGYFKLLGVKPLVGRLLGPADEQTAAPVAVISEEFWTSHLGRSPNVLGRILRLDDMPVTIVGVTAARFTGIHFAHHFQIAVPITVSPGGYSNRSIIGITMITRTSPSIGLSAQTARLDAAFHSCCIDAGDINALYASGSDRVGRASTIQHVEVDEPPIAATSAQYPVVGSGIHILLDDASRGVTWGVDFRARYRSVLMSTMAAALLLLLIACANVGTLLLARGEVREREFAIRRSLGASTARIKLQLLIEGLELTFVGSMLGFVLAALGTTLLLRNLPLSAAPLGDSIAWRSSAAVVGFTGAVMLVCAIATTMLPARRAAREELLGSLTGSRRLSGRSFGVDRVLVIAQVTLAIVLTSAAGLYVSTVHNLTRDEGGYHTRNILLARLDGRDLKGASASSRAADYAAVLQAATALPGAERVALTLNAPVIQDGLMESPVELLGSLEASQIHVRGNVVSTGYFSAAGIGLAAGRDFSSADDAAAPSVVIVSQAFERRHYGTRSALGRTVLLEEGATPLAAQIVGIARDAHYDRLAGNGPDLRNPAYELLYRPIAQSAVSYPFMTLVIRTVGDPLDLAQSVRRLSDRTTGIHVVGVTALGQVLDDAASRERFAAALASGFGVIALVLTAVGVFGVLWFNVSQRTREIGVRMALGAQPADVGRLVIRQSLAMTAVAALLGIPLTIACAWTVRAQFYGVGPTQPLTLIGSAALLTSIAIIASVIPCRHAARVDPIVALREEA